MNQASMQSFRDVIEEVGSGLRAVMPVMLDGTANFGRSRNGSVTLNHIHACIGLKVSNGSTVRVSTPI